MRQGFVLLAVLILSEGSAQAQAINPNAAIKQLAPQLFPQLPTYLKRALQARGCTIPQSHHQPTPHNVIRGEFARRGQLDWAVLCSRNKTSSILVFWRGSDKTVSEIAKAQDVHYLQSTGNKKAFVYSRTIVTVGAKYIRDHYQSYGGPKPPRITHQAIDDGFVGKASTVRYYYRGKWLALQGAD